MENKTSFDLNSEVRRWRLDLNQSAAMAADNLDELESHLRDSVRELQSRALSDEEAFLIARRRLGDSQALTEEFSKIRAAQVWIDRTLWIIVGVALFEALGSLQSSVALSSLKLVNIPFFLPVIIWMAPLVLAMLILRSIIRGTGWTPRILNNLARTPLKISATFFCLGMGTILFKAIALSRVTYPQRFIVVPVARDALVWLLLSLMIWGVARTRVLRARA